MADLIPFFGKFTARTSHAATAVTGSRFVAVVADMEGDAAEAAADIEHGYPQVGHATGYQYGVAMRDTAAGERVGVVVPGGEVPVEAGGVIAAGAALEVLADGRVVTLGTSATVADNVLAGIAMEAAAAAGEFIRVLIK